MTKAQSIADLMGRRSPGQRTQAILNKTKHKRHYAVLAERSPEEMPAVLLGRPIAEALLPAAPIEMPTLEFAQAAPAFPALFAPIPGGPVFFSPGGGGGGPGGGGGGPPGGGGGGPPAQPPPSQPPAVPEPGTWAMLIIGFAATGVALRRRRVAVAEPVRS